MISCFVFSVLLALSSFSIQFVQEKHSPILKEPLVSEGRLLFKMPDYVRWEYTSPDSMVWESSHADKAMGRYVGTFASLVNKSVKGDKQALSDDFEISEIRNTLSLMPRKRRYSELFRWIRITKNPKTQLADKVEFVEVNGDSTVIKFYNTVFL